MTVSRGSFNSIPSISPAYLLNFDDLYQLLDAIMLFGAALSRGGGHQVALAISRHRSQWASLGWIILLLENNDARLFRFHLTITEGGYGPKAVATTRCCQFFAPAFRRWYPDYERTGRCEPVTPHGLTLSPHALAFWTVDALVHAPPALPDQPLRFDAPNLTEKTSAILASQIRHLTGWKVKAQENEGRFHIQAPQAARPAIEAWISDLVPPEVWNAKSDKRRWSKRTSGSTAGRSWVTSTAALFSPPGSSPIPVVSAR